MYGAIYGMADFLTVAYRPFGNAALLANSTLTHRRSGEYQHPSHRSQVFDGEPCQRYSL